MYDLNWEVVVFVGRALLLLMIAGASSVFFLSLFNLCWLETLEDDSVLRLMTRVPWCGPRS